MKKKYIIGHKNPDTDSIVSALAYQEFKKLSTRKENYYAIRAGKLNPQTEYILDRFKVKPPQFINDLTPRVRNYLDEQLITVNENQSLWEALEILTKNNIQLVPVVDENNHYKSSLHYNIFAESLFTKMAPDKSMIISTSIKHLTEVLKSQPLVIFNEKETINAQILVAGMNFDSIKTEINAQIPEKVICIVGDRPKVQEFLVTQKIKILIIVGGKMPSNDLKKLAKKNEVSILISPFDSAKTSWLTLFASPVKKISDNSIEPLKEDDYISRITDKLKKAVSHTLPVIDKNNQVMGIFSERNLVNEPNIEIIMVDHNERNQAIEGLENYRILEIIDHHRLGNLHTNNPIKFINKPVGSTSTIITEMFRESKIPLRKEIASILLAGILSDTVILKSATTTEKDIEIAAYLSGITDLNIKNFGIEIKNVASQILTKSMDEILTVDMKEYETDKNKFSISQIEVVSPQQSLKKKDEFCEGLKELVRKNDYLFSAIMITDIVNLNSILIIKGNENLISTIGYPKVENNIYSLNGIISRKKQLIPYLMEIIKKFY